MNKPLTTKQLRKQLTKQRRALPVNQRKKLAYKASQHLHRLKTQLPANAKIGIYYDGFGEIPTQPIIDWCNRMGYTVYLPLVGTLGRYDKRLRFTKIISKKLNTLRTYTHSLGMKQPHSQSLLWATQLDALFCPLVALDSLGTRMGMGGGYYDRTLAKAHNFGITKNGQPAPLKVGWCYDFQLVNQLSKQTWDVPMDIAITPSKLVRF